MKSKLLKLVKIIVFPWIIISQIKIRRNKLTGTNIQKMPYDFKSTFIQVKKAKRNISKYFSPIRILSVFLKTILIEQRKKALLYLHEIPMKIDIHIVDVGAADGINSRWNQLGEHLRIDLFEPEPAAYQRLLQQLKNDDRVRIFNVALSEFGEKLQLNITKWPRASSIYDIDYAFMNQTNIKYHLEAVEQIQVESKKLSDVLKDEDISFIKADVEQYELPVLRGAEKLLNNCVGLELEVTFCSRNRLSAPVFSDIELFCREKGFSLIALENPSYFHYLLPNDKLESRGFIAGCNALFFRFPDAIIDLIMSKTWSKDKLSVAICLYLIYGNYEMAYVLTRKATEIGLIKESDLLYNNIIKCIKTYSGYSQLIPYNNLKSIMHYVEGSHNNDTLDY